MGTYCMGDYVFLAIMPLVAAFCRRRRARLTGLRLALVSSVPCWLVARCSSVRSATVAAVTFLDRHSPSPPPPRSLSSSFPFSVVRSNHTDVH